MARVYYNNNKRYKRRARKYSTRSRMSKRKMFRPGFSRTGGNYKFASRGVGPEMKFFDWGGGPLIPSDAGTVYPSMNLVAQGTGASQRIGRKITVKRWEITVNVVGSTDAGIDNVFRMIAFVDKQCNGTEALVSDILNVNVGFPAFLAKYNLANSERFAIIADKYLKLAVPAVSRSVQDLNNASPTYGQIISLTYIRPSTTFKITKPMNLPLEFSDGTPATIALVKSNNIGFIFIALSGGSEDAQFSFLSRLRYYDK